MLELCPRETYAPNTKLIARGATGLASLFVVEKGEVTVTAANDEKEIATLGPGKFFGVNAMLNNRPRTTTVKTSVESILLRLDQESFRQVIAADFLAALRLEDIATERDTMSGGEQG